MLGHRASNGPAKAQFDRNDVNVLGQMVERLNKPDTDRNILMLDILKRSSDLGKLSNEQKERLVEAFNTMLAWDQKLVTDNFPNTIFLSLFTVTVSVLKSNLADFIKGLPLNIRANLVVSAVLSGTFLNGIFSIARNTEAPGLTGGSTIALMLNSLESELIRSKSGSLQLSVSNSIKIGCLSEGEKKVLKTTYPNVFKFIYPAQAAIAENALDRNDRAYARVL